jgi:hypothetical protein
MPLLAPATPRRYGPLFMDQKGDSPWAVLFGWLGLAHVLGMGLVMAVYIGGPRLLV